jgi:hypothetical protein
MGTFLVGRVLQPWILASADVLPLSPIGAIIPDLGLLLVLAFDAGLGFAAALALGFGGEVPAIFPGLVLYRAVDVLVRDADAFGFGLDAVLTFLAFSGTAFTGGLQAVVRPALFSLS